jgi:tetratricopeptide (TPR) repeat protein
MNQKRSTILLILAIATLGFIVYANSLGGMLLLDDLNMIRDNVYIKSFSNIITIFTKDVDSGAARISNFYRPLQTLTYTIDYSLGGLNPVGYHITNVIIHILAALSIFWLLWLLFGDRTIAFFASALFVVHPVHTEAVAYISGIADPMVALFTILALIFYVKYDRQGRAVFYAVSLCAYFLALLSRESALVLIALVLLYDYTFEKKVNFLKRIVPFIAVTAAYFFIRSAVLKGLVFMAPQPTTLLQRLPGAFSALASYVRLLILPIHLRMEYGLSLFKFTDPKVIAGMAVLLLLLASIFFFRKKNKFVFFCLSWSILCILPVLNIYPINAYMAEHWLYLPSIGFFLLVSGGLAWLLRQKPYKAIAILAMAALMVFYSTLTIAQNSYWKDPVTFYTRTLKYAPNSFLMHNNLGNIYNDMGRKEEALECYKRSLAINPVYGCAYISMGSVLDDLGRRDEAIEMFKKATEIDPKDYVLAYVNLGIVYAATGKLDEAEAAYKKAIETAPSLAYAYSGLGMIYLGKGDANKALELCKKAVAMNPDLPNSYNDLGTVYGVMDKLQDAIAVYLKAISLAPGYGAAHYNLSVTYFKNGQYDLAIREYDIAVRLGVRPRPVYIELIEKYRSGERQ